MNNRIRYRQWWKDHWFHWGFIGDWAETGFIGPLCTSDRNDPVRTYPESFQSTGLHDSKGVEIWEGSIMSGGENPGVIKQRASGEWIIVRHSGAEWELFGELEYYHRNKIEITVIGDTTTTSDLMEVKK